MDTRKFRSALAILALIGPLGACATHSAPPAEPTPVPDPRPAFAPDLSLERAGCDGRSVAVRVANVGRTYAAPFRVSVTDPGDALVREWRIEGLAESETRILRFPGRAGTTYRVLADPEAQTDDTDRFNNELRIACGGSDQPDPNVGGGQCIGDRIYFQVANAGGGVGRFPVLLSDPSGRIVREWEVPGLAPGAVHGFTHNRQQSGVYSVLVDPDRVIADADRSNNETRIECGNDGGGRQSDLMVDSPYCQANELGITVLNVGAGRSEGFEVVLKRDGRIVEGRRIDGLRPGGSVTYRFGVVRGGRYEVIADPRHETPDRYWGNNATAIRCWL